MSRRSSILGDAAVAILAGSVFFWLATVVRSDAVPPFDAAVRHAVHSLAAPPLTIVLNTLTNLGSGYFVFPLAAILVFRLGRQGRRREAALLAIAVVGAKLVEHTIKPLVHRPRPDAFFDYPRPSSYSFPSGHALLSYSFYLTMAEVLTPPDWPRARQLAAWTVAVLLTLCTGLSRLYLGVHYPSDVLAGYAAAIAWTSIVRIGLRLAPRLKRRDGSERDGPPER